MPILEEQSLDYEIDVRYILPRKKQIVDTRFFGVKRK